MVMTWRSFHPGMLLGGFLIAVCSCAVAVSSVTRDGGSGGGQRAPAVLPITAPSMAPTTASSVVVAVEPPTPSTSAATDPATTEPATTAATQPPAAPPAHVIPVEPLAEPLPAIGKADGPDTERLQQRLLDLGLWVQSVDGTYGLTTRQAVMAFQKYTGLPSTGEVDYATADFLSQWKERVRASATEGSLVEVDKRRQLLFIVVDGITQWALNTSTGNDQPYEEPDKNDPGKIQRGVSTTPEGSFKVDRERAEGWWPGDLGEIYRPKYFKGGVAVHGSNSIPNYPASHGCVRVSVPAMDFIWDNNLMPMRSAVWVHS